MNLKQLQQRFVRELDQSVGKSVIDWLQATTLLPAKQMAIYRGSMQGGLTEILRKIFPVCDQLVGSDYFKQLASIYIAKIPHQQPDITYYGGHFASFIKASYGLHQLSYLADVAALEWACHLALNGPMVPKLNRNALAAVSQANQPTLRFGLYEASTLLYSSYPIQRIWQVNQENYQGDAQVSLEEGAIHLLVHRRVNALCLTQLKEEEFKMLTHFSKGETFEQVCQQCIEEYPSMDIPQCFAVCIQQEYLVNFVC